MKIITRTAIPRSCLQRKEEICQKISSWVTHSHNSIKNANMAKINRYLSSISIRDNIRQYIENKRIMEHFPRIEIEIP